MGQTITQLAKVELPENTIFPNRFVIEICEGIHFHYRNFRFLLTRDSWYQMAKGCADSLERWVKRGLPGFGNKHIELCRKEVTPDKYEMACVNLNKNLYNQNSEKVYSDGNRFTDKQYIHVKYRDLRIEMSIDEFKLFANMISEAAEQL